MLQKIIAKAERLAAVAGRYIDLDKAARWRKPALVIGMIGWAGRWSILGFYGWDVVSSAEAAEIALADGPTPMQKTVMVGIAVVSCMIVKWAGWTYGGVGFVHHRAKMRGDVR